MGVRRISWITCSVVCPAPRDPSRAWWGSCLPGWCSEPKGNLEELPGRTSPASGAVDSWISELMWSAWSNKSIQKQFWFTGLLFVLAFLFLSCLQWGLEFHKAEDNSLSLTADLVQFWLSPMSESQGQVVHVLGNPAPLWWISVGYWGDPIKCFLAQGELGNY